MTTLSTLSSSSHVVPALQKFSKHFGTGHFGTGHSGAGHFGAGHFGARHGRPGVVHSVVAASSFAGAIGGSAPPPNIKGSIVVTAFATLLSSLGIPLDATDLRLMFGGSGGKNDDGGGGGGGNWWDGLNDGDLAERLVKYFFGEGCVSCKMPCNMRLSVRIDVPTVIKATEHLVRVLDNALRKYKNTSLLKFSYEYITARADSKLRARKIPLRLRPVLRLGTLIQYDVTRGVRLKVLDYVFRYYVDYYLDYYLPIKGIKYDLKTLNVVLMDRFRPQVIAFLTGKDADIAPLVGWLTGYVLTNNDLTTIEAKHPACKLCKAIPSSCAKHKKKLKKKVKRELLRRGVRYVRRK